MFLRLLTPGCGESPFSPGHVYQAGNIRHSSQSLYWCLPPIVSFPREEIPLLIYLYDVPAVSATVWHASGRQCSVLSPCHMRTSCEIHQVPLRKSLLSLLSPPLSPFPSLFFLSPFSTPTMCACILCVWCCMYMFVCMQTSVHAEAM